MSRVDTNHSLAELLERQTNLLQFSRSQANRVDQASGTSRSNSHNSTAITTTTILIIISIGTTTTTTIDVGKWVLLIRRLTLVSATFASCGQWEVTRVKERESQSQSARHCSPDSECTHTQCKQLSTDYYCCWGNMCPLPTEKHTCKEWEKESWEKGQKWEAIAEGCRLCRQLSFTLCGSKSVSVSVGVSEGAPEHFTTAALWTPFLFLMVSPPPAERRTARNWATLSIAWHRHELCLLMSYAIDMAAASAAGAAGVHWPHWIALIAYSLQHYYSYSFPVARWSVADEWLLLLQWAIDVRWDEDRDMVRGGRQKHRHWSRLCIAAISVPVHCPKVPMSHQESSVVLFLAKYCFFWKKTTSATRPS